MNWAWDGRMGGWIVDLFFHGLEMLGRGMWDVGCGMWGGSLILGFGW
jgi:hypothetical protein